MCGHTGPSSFTTCCKTKQAVDEATKPTMFSPISLESWKTKGGPFKKEKIQGKLSLGSISTHKELMLSSETSYETKGGTLDSWLTAKLTTSRPTHFRCHYQIKLISKLVYVYLRNNNSKSS